MIGADDARVLLSQFEGWTLERVDESPAPDPTNVLTLRAPDGRVAWVALSGAFGQSLIRAWQLKAGHTLLTRIENAKWRAEQMDRTARIAARREASATRSMPTDSSAHALADAARRYEPRPDELGVDDCSPFGVLRPPLEIR